MNMVQFLQFLKYWNVHTSQSPTPVPNMGHGN